MKIKFNEAINLAHKDILKKYKKSACLGLGINDPKRIFGTTSDLLELFGSNRIIEPPTSENALTGIAFGMALNGYKTCLIHQRLDFALLSFDQIINTLSKWKFMFGDEKKEINCLIRFIIGRGWGQGPTHSQSYHSFLASLPGLDVYYPYDADTAYFSVFSGLTSGKPSLLFEHRWLHNTTSENINFDRNKFKGLQKLSEGSSFTIFSYGYLIPEIKKACDFLRSYSIEVDLISTCLLNNIDLELLAESIKQTKKVLFVEPFTKESSLTSSIFSQLLTEYNLYSIIEYSKIIALPSEHESTSYFQTKKRYVNWHTIVEIIAGVMKKEVHIDIEDDFHDIPGPWFKGPF